MLSESLTCWRDATGLRACDAILENAVLQQRIFARVHGHNVGLAGGVPRLAHVQIEMKLARFKEHLRTEATLARQRQ